MKTLVLGLGNPILSDDGIGIHVVRAAAAQYAQANGVTFAEASVGGLRLLDLLAGYDRVLLVDAIQTDEGRASDIYRLNSGDLPASLHSSSTHDLSLPEALELGRRLGISLPDNDRIHIIAVEVENVLTFGGSCTQAVQAAFPRIVETVLAQLEMPVEAAPILG